MLLGVEHRLIKDCFAEKGSFHTMTLRVVCVCECVCSEGCKAALTVSWSPQLLASFDVVLYFCSLLGQKGNRGAYFWLGITESRPHQFSSLVHVGLTFSAPAGGCPIGMVKFQGEAIICGDLSLFSLLRTI